HRRGDHGVDRCEKSFRRFLKQNAFPASLARRRPGVLRGSDRHRCDYRSPSSRAGNLPLVTDWHPYVRAPRRRGWAFRRNAFVRGDYYTSIFRPRANVTLESSKATIPTTNPTPAPADPVDVFLFGTAEQAKQQRIRMRLASMPPAPIPPQLDAPINNDIDRF